MVRNFSPAVLIILSLLALSCRQAEEETERTKAQLSKLARDVGADGMVESVSRAYQENVGSVGSTVQSAKETTDALAKAVPAVQAAQDAGAAASETLSEAKQVVVRKTTYVFSKLPDSEAELERTIDYYNQQFATWLRKNFITFDHENFSERRSVRSRYQPRPIPKR